MSGQREFGPYRATKGDCQPRTRSVGPRCGHGLPNQPVRLQSRPNLGTIWGMSAKDAISFVATGQSVPDYPARGVASACGREFLISRFFETGSIWSDNTRLRNEAQTAHNVGE